MLIKDNLRDVIGQKKTKFSSLVFSPSKERGGGCSEFLAGLFPLQQLHSPSSLLIKGSVGVLWELRWQGEARTRGSDYV